MLPTTIIETEKAITELKEHLVSLRRSETPQPFRSDFVFETAEGIRSLADLFGEHADLLVVHNMGKSCSYCTMWADGFSGYLRHLETRAAFVVVSPDPPEVQAKLAEARKWTFRMVRDATGDFTRECGYLKGEDWWPGVTAFHRNEDASIVKGSTEVFGPGDDYCLPWRMFDLIVGGVGDWEPR